MSDSTFGKTQGAKAQEERNGLRTGVHPKGFKVLWSFLILPLGGSLDTPRGCSLGTAPGPIPACSGLEQCQGELELSLTLQA